MLIAEGPGVSSANSAERANTSHFCPAVKFPLRVREVVGSIPEPSTAFVVRRNSRLLAVLEQKIYIRGGAKDSFFHHFTNKFAEPDIATRRKEFR